MKNRALHIVNSQPPAQLRQRFDRGCNIVALLWLLLVGTTSFALRPNPQDFGQYYIGGVMAAQGRWADLYPTPLPGSYHNPGTADASTMHPAYAAAAAERGVGDVNRFFQPPPVAVPLMVFSVLSYRHAQLVWLMLMTLCAWGVSLQAGEFYRRCSGPAAHGGWVTLLVAVSPLMYRGLRTFQITPAVALLLGSAALCWPVRRRAARFAIAFVWAGLFKYASAALLPMFAIYRKGRPLIGIAIVTVVFGSLPLALGGGSAWRIYLGTIVPLLGRSDAWRGNQSIEGLLLRLTGGDVLPGGAILALRSAMIAIGIGIILVLAKVRRRRFHVRAAAAALLLCWLLLFSPLFWEHYAIYLCPIWGWLIAEARLGGWRRILAVAGIGLNYCPLAITPLLAHGGLAISHMTLGTVCIAAAALITLLKSAQRETARAWR